MSDRLGRERTRGGEGRGGGEGEWKGERGGKRGEGGEETILERTQARTQGTHEQ